MRKVFKENPGDLAGANTFQGNGRINQLDKPKLWDLLRDKEQEEKDHVYGNLESDFFDDKPHLNHINEREGSEIFYRDLPGFPAMNTLNKPKTFLPDDPEPYQDLSQTNLSNLIPLPKQERLIDNNEDNHELNLEKEPTASSWKEINPEDFRNLSDRGNYEELVYKQDWVPELDSEKDVMTRPGSLSQLVYPKKYTPEVVEQLIREAIDEIFKSQAQRKYFWMMAQKKGGKWKRMAKEFEKETPKQKKLPKKK